MKIHVPALAAALVLTIATAGPAGAKGGGGGGGTPPPPPPPTTTNPSAPVLVSPAAGASVVQPVTISWARAPEPRRSWPTTGRSAPLRRSARPCGRGSPPLRHRARSSP